MQHFLLFWLFYHVEHTPENMNTRGLSLTLGMIKQRVILILISYLSTPIYYCDKQNPKRIAKKMFTVLFSAKCHVVLSIKLGQLRNKDYSASKSLLRKNFFLIALKSFNSLACIAFHKNKMNWYLRVRV